MRCGRCRQRTYCSKQCQVSAWKDGHKQECKALQEERQQRVSAAFAPHGTATVLMKLSDEGNHRGVVKMAEEGLAVAGAQRSARPELAAGIYRILGDSYSACCEHVKGLELLEQARALAVEAALQRQGEHEDWWLRRANLGEVCNSLGTCHMRQGEDEKAIAAEYEQARAIAMELGRLEYEQARACNGLGVSY